MTSADLLAFLRLALELKRQRAHWGISNNLMLLWFGSFQSLSLPDLSPPYPVYKERDLETFEETGYGLSPYLLSRSMKGHDNYLSIVHLFKAKFADPRQKKIIHQLIYKALGAIPQ